MGHRIAAQPVLTLQQQAMLMAERVRVNTPAASLIDVKSQLPVSPVGEKRNEGYPQVVPHAKEISHM